MGLFNAISRKSAIQGEPVEAAHWRSLGVRSARVIDLFVLRPQSDPAKKFLKTLGNLRNRFENEVETTDQFGATEESLEAVASEFAISQRQDVERLVAELGFAVSETLEKFASSIDAAGKPIGGMEDVRLSLVEAQRSPSLEETRKCLSKGIVVLRKLVEDQTARELNLRKEYQAHSKKLSAHLVQAYEEGRTDTLTSLANRRAYQEHMEQALSIAREDKTKRSLCLIDLDGFKALNDTYGHAAGDAALVSFGNRLRMSVGNRAFVARLGGDEFIVEGDMTPAMLHGMFVKLSNSCGEHPCFHEDRRLTIRFSYGIIEFDGSEPEETVRKKADAALYASKQTRGRAA